MIEKEKVLLELLSEYKRLGIADQIDYEKFYLYSIITHSTAIEGSTVTEIENRLLFDEGISANGRSIQEQMMNLDLKNAYERSIVLAKNHSDYSVDMLKELSSLVMKNTGGQYNTISGTFDAAKGDLRLVGVTAGIGGKSYMNYKKIPAKLEEFCNLLNQRRSQILKSKDVVEKYMLSFDAHYQLVSIHPWVDGNGRMSRLVMNQLQFEFGIVPVKIIKENKAEYIKALDASREHESAEIFRNFMLENHIENISKEIDEYKKSMEFDPIKSKNDPIKSKNDPINIRLFNEIKKDNNLTYSEYSRIIGVSEATIKRKINELKREGIIVRVGSNKTGHWEIIEKNIS